MSWFSLIASFDFSLLAFCDIFFVSFFGFRFTFVLRLLCLFSSLLSAPAFGLVCLVAFGSPVLIVPASTSLSPSVVLVPRAPRGLGSSLMLLQSLSSLHLVSRLLQGPLCLAVSGLCSRFLYFLSLVSCPRASVFWSCYSLSLVFLALILFS